MTMSSFSRRRAVIGLGLVGLLGGCGTTPPPRLFTLAPRPAVKPNRMAAKITVKGVTVAKYLDRPQIVRFGTAYELSVSEFERWGEGMSDMVTRVLVEDLSLRLPESDIFAASGAAIVPADASVDVDIDRFDADPDNAVILAARWVVRREPQALSSRADRIVVRPRSPATVDLVSAMSDALGQLGDSIASVIAT